MTAAQITKSFLCMCTVSYYGKTTTIICAHGPVRVEALELNCFGSRGLPMMISSSVQMQ